MADVKYRDDSEDLKRSLQYKQPTLCDGQATGLQCRHFWHMIVPIDVHNSTVVSRGEKSRLCTLINTEDGMRLQGPSRPEMPTYCNRYEPSSRPYNPDFEDYKPLTPEQIEAIDNDQPIPGEIKQFPAPKINPVRRFLLRILP